MRNRTTGITALEDGLFVNLLIFDYLYSEIGGAGYRSVDRESCTYELTLVAGGAAPASPASQRFASLAPSAPSGAAPLKLSAPWGPRSQTSAL